MATLITSGLAGFYDKAGAKGYEDA